MRLSIVSVAALVLAVASSTVAAPVPNPSEVLVEKRTPFINPCCSNIFQLLLFDFLKSRE
ncbi:hypothetical protein FRC19_006277, partial [Serendipita sp. 401]